MAAGKSTVGRILAERLGWEFVDFDRLILERVGQDPGGIIREHGEAVFRAMEAELTHELATRRQVVLAPGGGWAAVPGAAETLGPGTLRVWLRITAAEAIRRAEADGVDRPLLGPPGVERTRRAAELLAAREAAYGTAELTVDVDGKRAEEVADEIVRRLDARRGG